MQSCLTLVEGLGAGGQASREPPAAHPSPKPCKTPDGEAGKSSVPWHCAGGRLWLYLFPKG